MIKIFKFWKTRLRETPHRGNPSFSLFYVVLIPTYFENLGHLQLERFKSSKFLNACLRRILQHFTTDFRRSPVVCDIYSTINRSLTSLSFRFKCKMKKRNNKNERNKEKRKKEKQSKRTQTKERWPIVCSKNTNNFHQHQYLLRLASAFCRI